MKKSTIFYPMILTLFLFALPNLTIAQQDALCFNVSVDVDCEELTIYVGIEGMPYNYDPSNNVTISLDEFSIYNSTNGQQLNLDPVTFDPQYNGADWYFNPQGPLIVYTVDISGMGAGGFSLGLRGSLDLEGTGISGDWCTYIGDTYTPINIYNYPENGSSNSFSYVFTEFIYFDGGDPGLYIQPVSGINCPATTGMSNSAYLARLTNATNADYNNYIFTWSTGHTGVLTDCVCTNEITLTAEHKETGCIYTATYTNPSKFQTTVVSSPCSSTPFGGYTHFILQEIQTLWTTYYSLLNPNLYQVTWSDGHVGPSHPCTCSDLTYTIEVLNSGCTYNGAVDSPCWNLHTDPWETVNPNHDDQAASHEDQSGSHGDNTSTGGPIRPLFPRVDGEEFKISIFPNPVSHSLFIQSEESDLQYEIYSIDGKQIASGTLANSWEFIPVSDFPKGSYLVKVTSGDMMYTKKIIKL